MSNQHPHNSLFLSLGGIIGVILGEGVVGMYPLLTETAYRVDEQRDRFTPITSGVQEGTWINIEPSSSPSNGGDADDGGEGFRYQSFSGKSLPGGSFGGELIFIAGSLQDSSGEPFSVEVGRFSLEIPTIILL